MGIRDAVRGSPSAMILVLLSVVGAPAAAETIAQAFPPPPGAARIEADAFGAWLGERPLKSPTEPVRTHTGAVVHHSARVVDMPLVPGDLQQCADSAIRLRAEWLRETGAALSFHATSGDPMPYDRYRAGERPIDRGGRVAWVAGGDGDFEGWLAAVFMYAGTRSLALDTHPADAPRAGDLLVVPGGPGHAVVLLDVARRGDETLVLIGEGYMPAQDFHVELGPEAGWWRWEGGVSLPHWEMPAEGLRRW